MRTTLSRSQHKKIRRLISTEKFFGRSMAKEKLFVCSDDDNRRDRRFFLCLDKFHSQP